MIAQYLCLMNTTVRETCLQHKPQLPNKIYAGFLEI
jgi:hypothetical protein